jgi:hypothetical protein
VDTPNRDSFNKHIPWHENEQRIGKALDTSLVQSRGAADDTIHLRCECGGCQDELTVSIRQALEWHGEKTRVVTRGHSSSAPVAGFGDWQAVVGFPEPRDAAPTREMTDMIEELASKAGREIPPRIHVYDRYATGGQADAFGRGKIDISLALWNLLDGGGRLALMAHEYGHILEGHSSFNGPSLDPAAREIAADARACDLIGVKVLLEFMTAFVGGRYGDWSAAKDSSTIEVADKRIQLLRARLEQETRPQLAPFDLIPAQPTSGHDGGINIG